MNKFTLLLVAATIGSCQAIMPTGPVPAVAPTAGTQWFSHAAFSFSYPSTWEQRPTQRDGELSLLSRRGGLASLVVQKYRGSGSLLPMQQYEETEAEGALIVSEEAELGGLPSFRVESQIEVDGRQLTHGASGAIHHGAQYHVGYVYDPEDRAQAATVAEIRSILDSWTWH